MLKKIIDFKATFKNRVYEYFEYISFDDFPDEILLGRLDGFLKLDDDNFWIEMYNLKLSNKLLFGNFFMKAQNSFQRDVIVSLDKRYAFDFIYENKLRFNTRESFLCCLYNDYALCINDRLTNEFFVKKASKGLDNLLTNWRGDLSEKINVSMYLSNIKNNEFCQSIFIEQYIRFDYSRVIDICAFSSSKNIVLTINKINDALSVIKEDIPSVDIYLEDVRNDITSKSKWDAGTVRFLVIFKNACYTDFAVNF